MPHSRLSAKKKKELRGSRKFRHCGHVWGEAKEGKVRCVKCGDLYQPKQKKLRAKDVARMRKKTRDIKMPSKRRM